MSPVLPSPEVEARAFWRMRFRVLRTLLWQTLAMARFRASLVAALSALLWAGLFWLFADGFSFLAAAIPSGEIYQRTVNLIFGGFFFALLLMLMLSSGIILYAALFRSPEMSLLLTAPVRTERVFLHKFQEAVVFSSWGFVLLGSPMLLAYGVVAGAPWYYYAMLLPFIAAFVYIPVSLGALLCLAIVDRVPQAFAKLLIALFFVLLAAGAWQVWHVLVGARSDLLTPTWFQELIRRLQIAENQLLPSWWLCAGLLDAAAGSGPADAAEPGRELWHESVLFLVLTVANALFLRQAAIWTAGRALRRAYSAVSGRQPPRRRVQAAWLDRAVARLLARAPTATRLLLIKDLRNFRRDPVQWSQVLIFFGLLVLYFFNMGGFSYNLQYAGWVNMVSFLNLSVVGLLMSTFTTRFIYPLASLEGRRFWLLGLLPLGRSALLWNKFLFAVAGSLVPCCGLILLSDAMLSVEGLVVLSHQLTCVVLCVGLAGIAVGLGARFANLREQSPARIAAGFGGTLNLVVSALYIVVVVLLTAVPCHFYLAGQRGPAAWLLGANADVRWWLRFWLAAGTLASLAVGALAAIAPMAIGLRAFRRIEF